MTLDEVYERAVAAAEKLNPRGYKVEVAKKRRGRTKSGELGLEVEVNCPLPVLVFALEALVAAHEYAEQGDLPDALPYAIEA